MTQWYVLDGKVEVPRSFSITDYGDPVSGPPGGLYGAFVIEPSGSTYHDPRTGAPVKAGVAVDVRNPALPGGGFRDVALIFQDLDQVMNRDVMPYRKDVTGVSGINYKSAPFGERLQTDPNIAHVMHSEAQHGDPATTMIYAVCGDQVRLHVLGGVGHQSHVFSIDGHRYPFSTARPDGMMFNSRQVGPMVAVDIVMDGGAGGTGGARDYACGVPGDYLYGDRRVPFLEAGMWGIMRVEDRSRAEVLPLKGLEVGWNLVSAAVKPANTSVAQFLDSISGKFDAVATTDPDKPGQWLYYSPTSADNTLANLDETKGFWVHMTAPGFLAPAGTAPTKTDIPLKKGWNLVGWPSAKSMPMSTALSSIGGKYDRVYAYDVSNAADPWRSYDPAAPAYANELTYVQPLRGYWIHMTADATLTVNN